MSPGGSKGYGEVNLSLDVQGMNVAEVRALAASLRAESEEIEAMVASLTSQLHGMRWRGPDREKFLGRWDDRHVVALRKVSRGLAMAAAQADEHAEAQEWASR